MGVAYILSIHCYDTITGVGYKNKSIENQNK